MTIRTATGDVEPHEVGGLVLAHEHLAIDLSTSDDAAAAVTDGDAVVDDLVIARERGGLGLVVDLTCRGMGRDAARAAKIAERAGVRLVLSTGYYHERFHPAGEIGDDPEALAASLVDEIETGLDGSTMRPGVLGEIGSSGTASRSERTSLRAAAIAATRTGRSVATHAHLGRGGLEQLDLLQAAGLDPRRIVIGHQDLIDDPEQHRRIAAAGAYVAFDTIGKSSYQSDEVRLRLLLALLEGGFERQIVMSNDVSRDSYLTGHGGQGFMHALGSFRDALAGAGVGVATLALLYRENALRWLEGA